MRVPNNSISSALLGNLQRLTAQQSKLQNQVSTGQRFTLASEDPAAASRVLDLQAEKQRIQQFSRNTDRAVTISQTTYSAVSGLKNISDRAGELAVLGSGVTSPEALRSYATELNQLIEQGVQTLNSTYGGDQLFGGTKIDAPAFSETRNSAGEISAVTYDGAADAAQVRISEGATIATLTDGATNQRFGDFVNRLVALRDGLAAGDAAGVQAVRSGLDDSEDDILTSVSEIGAKQTRLEVDKTQNAARFSELEKLTSAETDVDLSETIVKLTKTQTAYQAALQTGAQVLNLSLLDYLR